MFNICLVCIFIYVCTFIQVLSFGFYYLFRVCIIVIIYFCFCSRALQSKPIFELNWLTQTQAQILLPAHYRGLKPFNPSCLQPIFTSSLSPPHPRLTSPLRQPPYLYLIPFQTPITLYIIPQIPHLAVPSQDHH